MLARPVSYLPLLLSSVLSQASTTSLAGWFYAARAPLSRSEIQQPLVFA